ncbi:MAG: choice-of-anchor J domain-containing protein [Candidatus Scalindua sp.]|nr:choice-of-anchor J domain-containing protein [Candidatus Scalindua sp.]
MNRKKSKGKSIINQTTQLLTALFFFLGVAVTPVHAENLIDEGFESGWGGWSADCGVWEIGLPRSGPGYSHDGSLCAGTALDGNYPNNTDSRLISPAITLPSVADHEEIYLEFWHWFSYLNNPFSDDKGYVQIKVYYSETGKWSDWTTLGSTIKNTSSVWTLRKEDLTRYSGKKIQIAFYHRVDDVYTSTGWYIDNIEISGPGASSPAF